jgi:hypothetical protein
MSTVAAVHKDMHQGAGKDEQPGKQPQKMRPMFRYEVEAGKAEENDENDVRARQSTLISAFVIAAIHPRLLHS